MSEIYWTLRGLPYEEKLKKLEEQTHSYLCCLVLNERYNRFLSNYSNYQDGEEPIDKNIENGQEYEKRIPYHGWYWREIDFFHKKIPIGIGDYKGFMANNKWYLPEGYLNEDQFTQVISIIDKAMMFNEEGGEISEIRRKTVEELEKLWPLIQEFKIIVEY
jgi:hypothetical protein